MAYAVIAVLVLLSGAPVWAQQPGLAPGGGPQMMQMCRQMMGHEGPMVGMMGTMPMMSSDSKQQAEMMAMRGEMMKAMGGIMMKYAERMRPGN